MLIVQPETVVRWHRAGFRHYWRWKSRPKGGRKPIDQELRMLIRRLCRENPIWGAPRIQSELTLLGYSVFEATVAKYMPARSPRPSATWNTFLRNHLNETVAIDFFTVPTATFRLLYCFVVLHHDRRRILHFNVTAHPHAMWISQQLVEARLPHAPVAGSQLAQSAAGSASRRWRSLCHTQSRRTPSRIPPRRIV